MAIRHVVLDFDGTCTKVEDVASDYVDACIEMFERDVRAGTRALFLEKLAVVKAASPVMGWEFSIPPLAITYAAPSAPAYADPYIAVGEAVKLVLRALELDIRTPIPDLHTPSNDRAEAPWRDEMIEVLSKLHEKRFTIHFVSNSKTAKIEARLDKLLEGKDALRKAVRVKGEAGKFVVRDAKGLAPEFESAFFAIPAASDARIADKRPIYLRRGGYFEALADIWGNVREASETLVCGDIWELDLAMPAHLGAEVHLVERLDPHPTYDYEKAAVKALGQRATFGALRDVLDRI